MKARSQASFRDDREVGVNTVRAQAALIEFFSAYIGSRENASLGYEDLANSIYWRQFSASIFEYIEYHQLSFHHLEILITKQLEALDLHSSSSLASTELHCLMNVMKFRRILSDDNQEKILNELISRLVGSELDANEELIQERSKILFTLYECVFLLRENHVKSLKEFAVNHFARGNYELLIKLIEPIIFKLDKKSRSELHELIFNYMNNFAVSARIKLCKLCLRLSDDQSGQVSMDIIDVLLGCCDSRLLNDRFDAAEMLASLGYEQHRVVQSVMEIIADDSMILDLRLSGLIFCYKNNLINYNEFKRYWDYWLPVMVGVKTQPANDLANILSSLKLVLDEQDFLRYLRPLFQQVVYDQSLSSPYWPVIIAFKEYICADSLNDLFEIVLSVFKKDFPENIDKASYLLIELLESLNLKNKLMICQALLDAFERGNFIFSRQSCVLLKHLFPIISSYTRDNHDDEQKLHPFRLGLSVQLLHYMFEKPLKMDEVLLMCRTVCHLGHGFKQFEDYDKFFTAFGEVAVNKDQFESDHLHRAVCHMLTIGVFSSYTHLRAREYLSFFAENVVQVPLPSELIDLVSQNNEPERKNFHG